MCAQFLKSLYVCDRLLLYNHPSSPRTDSTIQVQPPRPNPFATTLYSLGVHGHETYELAERAGHTNLAAIEGTKKSEQVQRYGFAVLMGSIAFWVLILMFGILLGQLISISIIDHEWARLCWMLASPVLGVWLLPFVEMAVRNPWQLMQAILRDRKTSLTWTESQQSCQVAVEGGFRPPHITILIPVYKESVAGVLIPTIRSLLRAVRCYQEAGGKVNIVVCDDGLQLIDHEERSKRIKLYSETGLAWVARPRHGTLIGYTCFIRKGKFKKASNLNNACYVALETQERMRAADANNTFGNLTPNSIPSTDRDLVEYIGALSRTSTVNWTGGDVRLGEILFCIDSDCRFPSNFLLPMAVELFLNPYIGILHYLSKTMMVMYDTFEDWCSWSKRQIDLNRRAYAISGASVYSRGCFEAIRLSSLQSISYWDEDDRPKYWSESHVFADFDLNLRTLIAGHQITLAAYHTSSGYLQFLEGVSLTIYHELAWYEKNAYAKSELVFYPVRYWVFRGPFTSQFRQFIFSNSLPLAQRLWNLYTLGTDFVIASSFPLVIFNYFYIGFQESKKTWPYYYYWKMFLLSFAALIICVCVPLPYLQEEA